MLLTYYFTSLHSKELFSQLLHCISEFCDGMREQIVAYHTQLCTTALLHDAESHDWASNRAFFEVMDYDVMGGGKSGHQLESVAIVTKSS